MSGSAAGITTGTTTADTDVVCLGESMVTFLPSQPGRLADVPTFGRGIGGAESNVACALAAAGHRTKWVSRVGADGFGDHLVETITGYGVDTSAVRRDAHRPTGIYFRTATDRGTDCHEVAYYRAGSAASAMSPHNVPYDDVLGGRILHLSGITAALSADCLALLYDLTEPRPGRPLISFDVNHRPGLWRGNDAGPGILLDLARRCDLVFVGEDEAQEAWGLADATAIRAALPEPEILVVKRGGLGATVFAHQARQAHPEPSRPHPEPPQAHPRSGPAPDAPAPAPPATTTPSVTVPALHVDVIAPVGAGDAFAAGFLSATLRELPVRDRVRHGHLMAAAVLTVPGDLTDPPARAHADRLVALDDTAWERLRLGPGWTAAGALEEVRHP